MRVAKKCRNCDSNLHKVNNKYMYFICLDCKRPVDKFGCLVVVDENIIEKTLEESNVKE